MRWCALACVGTHPYAHLCEPLVNCKFDLLTIEDSNIFSNEFVFMRLTISGILKIV